MSTEQREQAKAALTEASKEMFAYWDHKSVENFRAAFQRCAEAGLCSESIDNAVKQGEKEASLEAQERWRM